ncbi:TRAP-type mannitol/chloroaromatic compound transport system, small permease component [Desulfocicer vacuolatum DSM 3385]|uniref:TRAP-type mannitol/chloroaromatic compound transport system, small permease component n=1 Tax=Desulfocicer vacuolatum DSM 3385 TaxID=1121400 RepID=A0A1W2EGX6_9BACT|nr:TRAP transporter small permease subunit [Desulfocicer vacuolatum]SMD08937.1 TRAP-type mannitol/chloroaromatic compound transport system, small permease component [Desulfocicer vacuolatum DSM 3385]
MKNGKQQLMGMVTIIDRTNGIIGKVLATVVLVMAGIMLYEAVSRHFFQSPTSWANEISKMVFGFYMIWAGAHAMLHKEHISMDLFYDRWTPRAKAMMDSITFVFFILFISLLLQKVGADAIFAVSIKETSNSTLSQPLYHWRASLVVGIVLLAIQGLAHFIRNIWFAVYGEELK